MIKLYIIWYEITTKYHLSLHLKPKNFMIRTHFVFQIGQTSESTSFII